jgi:hypothetical protein
MVRVHKGPTGTTGRWCDRKHVFPSKISILWACIASQHVGRFSGVVFVKPASSIVKYLLNPACPPSLFEKLVIF